MLRVVFATSRSQATARFVIRELKARDVLSTRTVTGSDFTKKVTSHVTDIKSQTSKLAIWRLWRKTKSREEKFILGAITLFLF